MPPLPLGPAPRADEVAKAIASLPDTVHATVLARLDALEPMARRVVQLGAVLGRTFQLAELPALAPDAAEADLAAAVEALVERDLLRDGGRSGLTFRHILIREVAYGTLPRAERARLHAAAGAWLDGEATGAGREDELAELVAFHLREATTLGRLVGEPVSPELVERTVRWLRRAGYAAASGAATTEAAHHVEAAIELAPEAGQPELHERLGQIWLGGEQALDAFERANALANAQGRGPEMDLRTLAQAVIVRTRWTGSVGVQQGSEEGARRIARIEALMREPLSDRARLLGSLGVAFGSANLSDAPDAAALAKSAVAAGQALEIARRLDDPDSISAALDAFSTVALGDDRVEDVLVRTIERRQIADRLSTNERMDAWIVTAWMETLRGNLGAAEAAAAEARSGLGAGQAAAWAIGASAWRTVALHALGRWDEALVEAGRAERSWEESEIRAPSFGLGGFVCAMAICLGRADPEGAQHWKAAAGKIFERSDPGIRTQRMVAYVADDRDRLAAEVVHDFRVFTGRFDYVHLALAHLADVGHPINRIDLDAIIDYTEERGIRLVAAAARRGRGLVLGDSVDLEAALAQYEAMSAAPFVARLRIELGLLRGGKAMVEDGLRGLDALGDVAQLSRASGQVAAAGISDA